MQAVKELATKTVRCGTKFTPTTAHKMIAAGPSTDDIMRASLWPSARCTAQDWPKRTVAKLPSISLIQNCIGDKRALFHWQKRSIDQLGYAAFILSGTERMNAGTALHKAAEEMITQLSNDTRLPQLPDILEKTKPSAKDFVASLYPTVSSFTPSPDSLVCEKNVVHHDLMFQGRFDAVFKYKDKLCLVDWKTSPVQSAVAKNMEGSDDLSGMYGYPAQVAAYVAAFNSDPEYRDRGQVEHAAVVLVFDNGSPAKVVEMDKAQLEKSWRDFQVQLDSYWRAIESSDGEANFIFSGQS